MFGLTTELKLHGTGVSVGDALLYWDSSEAEWVRARVVAISGRLTIILPNGRQLLLGMDDPTTPLTLAWNEEDAHQLGELRELREGLLADVESHRLQEDRYHIFKFLETGDPGDLSPAARAKLVDMVSRLDRDVPEKTAKRKK